MPIAENLNGLDRCLEPFPPGTFEEYEILEDGKTRLLKQGVFHGPGDKPGFRPSVLYEG